MKRNLLTIRWANAALSDLEQIETYIARDNPSAAIDTIISIIERVELLLEQPHVGRPGRVYGSREWVVHGTPYIVAYGVTANALNVYRVLHESKQWPDTF